MKIYVVISIILLSNFSILPQKGENGIAPPKYIGLKKGDWMEYSYSHYYEYPMRYAGEWRNETKIVVWDNDYKTTISVLNVTGTEVTFKEVRKFLNGSIHWQQTVSGDPTKPHFVHPEFRINDLFIPANLEAGDRVPQTLAFPDSQDNVLEVPWGQYINETVEKTFLGVKREANRIYWNKYVSGNSSQGKYTFDYYIEKDSYYDRSTGMMLQYFYNYTKIYHHIGTNEEQVLAGTYDYRVSDTNLWPKPLWMRQEVQLTSVVAIFVCLLLVFMKWRNLIPQ